MGDSQTKTRLFSERVSQAHWPKGEPELEEAQDSYQEARAQVRQAAMLDVRLRNGTIESFPYAYLTRVRYIPGDILVLRFGMDEVHAEGRNLARLRDAVSEHRMRFIQEGSEEDDRLKPEEAPHIGRIVITERDAL